MPTILYAEDDFDHRRMMRDVLTTLNVSLVEAVNGIEAIEAIRKQQIDLILLDLFMPKVDGFGVMEAVQSFDASKQAPIVVLSAWPTGDNRRRAEAAGAVDFLTKPYDPEYLIDIIHRLVKVDTAPLSAS